RHPNEANVPKIDELSAADDSGDRELPPADDTIDDCVRRIEAMSLAERQIVHRVQLEGMADIAGVTRRVAELYFRRAEREEIRLVLAPEHVARLRLQTAGEPATQLELQRIGARAPETHRHVRTGERVGID